VREFILSMLAVFRVFCQSRSDTALEVLAIRQQVAVLKRKRPGPGIELLGSTVLDDAPPPLVTLERRARHRKARDRHQLAPQDPTFQRHSTSECGVVVQQLREAFPEASPYRYVILDRDAKFDATVITFLKATGLKPKRTSIQSPWQNGTAERWVGSCRREIRRDHGQNHGRGPNVRRVRSATRK
jgi:hypothetical protein